VAYVVVSDTTTLEGPGFGFREVGGRPKGTVVRTMEKRDGCYRLESGAAEAQYWIEEELTQRASCPRTSGNSRDRRELGSVLELPLAELFTRVARMNDR
jgi:hypothetical protein